ncbi:Hint domain-containing protein [Tranquillimonas rosea]|uniref:Hint domain-containing protein n=1 Tax=Tranquillimonas rosea TaxID=641238 RepID=A0A1H9S8L6_9RHOB|nr:Hint domain-containing protein [Tranquillimonas rosea]SER81258.1 Hint domain-containing protein [Tranquillimonas rosea]
MSFMERVGAADEGCLTGVSGEALLQTPCGARRAEFVRPGDLIVTRTGGLRPVRLVWTHRIGRARMQADPGTAPVRLAARALGPMMPARGFLLAPAHRVLLPGWMLEDGGADGGLLEAGALAGGTDAAWRDRAAEEVTFYNFVFDRHEVLCASGLPVETFRPRPDLLDRFDAGTRLELVRRFPALRRSEQAFPALPVPVAPAASYLAAME